MGDLREAIIEGEEMGGCSEVGLEGYAEHRILTHEAS